MAYEKCRVEQQIDNERVRVTLYDLAPETEVGPHVHEYDYVIVPQTDGVLTIHDTTAGELQAPLTAGVSYFRNAGVSHNVLNLTDSPIRFIEVEFKTPA